MPSPRTLGGDPGAAPATCAEPGCERPAVQSAAHCRVHLADVLREEGEPIPFADPEMRGLYAAAVQIARTALAGPLPDLLEPGAPAVAIDMYALLSPDDDWASAQLALDYLGTDLSDAPPITGMVLSPPMEYQSKILLSLQLRVPAPQVDELLPRLQLALETVVREVVGSTADVRFTVGRAKDSHAPSD